MRASVSEFSGDMVELLLNAGFPALDSRIYLCTLLERIAVHDVNIGRSWRERQVGKALNLMQKVVLIICYASTGLQ
jgi:hypothetical protein